MNRLPLLLLYGLPLAMLIVWLVGGGTMIVDCTSLRYFDGVLVTCDGKPFDGWVGAAEKEVDSEKWSDKVADRERWGKPEESFDDLTHTSREGSFHLESSDMGITHSKKYICGVCVSATEVPEVPILDGIFLHVHDQNGWHSFRVSLTPGQQAKHKPAARWIELGRVVVPSQAAATHTRPYEMGR